MLMCHYAIIRPTGILAAALFLAPQFALAETVATEMFDPNVTANVQLTSTGFELFSSPFSLFTQQILSLDVDNRTIMEFPLASVPTTATITAATLELDVSALTDSGGDPNVPVFGYAGDGVAEVNDASVTGNLLGESGHITGLGPISIDLDVGFIDGLVGNSTHLGLLLIGDPGGSQAGFDNFDPNSTPVLTVTFTCAPGDFDCDDDVDGDDFLLWQRNPSVGDLSDWEDNYGGSPLVGAVAAVPEPATLGLALSVAAGLLILRRPAPARRG